MKQVKIILHIFFLLLLINACKKDNSNILAEYESLIHKPKLCYNPKKDSSYLASSIIGTWKWIGEYFISQSTGEKIYTTPLSEGYLKKIIFNNSGRCFFYKNASYTGGYYYEIARMLKYTWYYTDSNFVLGFKDTINNKYYGFNYLRPCKDTLVLSSVYDASPIGFYIRN